jgi:hypothetical protein
MHSMADTFTGLPVADGGAPCRRFSFAILIVPGSMFFLQSRFNGLVTSSIMKILL